MKLAISNIAWPGAQNEEVAKALVRCGVGGIEVAPTKIWPDPRAATSREIASVRRWWNRRGVQIVAAQALLFGRPELTIFESPTVRRQTLEYLQRVTRVCADLGAEALVFGSPRNRRVGQLPLEEAHTIAVDFFGRLGTYAASCGTAIALEANPSEYGADYITSSEEALRLVKRVGSPGCRLHLDTACVTLSGDTVDNAVTSAGEWLWHFHISEPHLAAVGDGTVDHAPFADALRRLSYRRWISIEMKERPIFTIAQIEEALTTSKALYFN